MMNKFALPVFAVIAILGAFTMSAFSEKSPEAGKAGDPKVVNTYFEFTGAAGQEDDESKWSQVTQAMYSNLDCDETYDGCALITTKTQTLVGVLRPQLVDVTVIGLHKNPIPSGASGVTSVGYKNP